MKKLIVPMLALTIPAASPVSARVDLPTDVASGWDFDKSLKLGFKPWGYKIVSADDGHPVRAGKQSIRFEVRPGDCSRNSVGHDDCLTDRERHELVQTGSTQIEGDDWWYAWSLYMPEDYPNVFPTKVALGQFHQSSKVTWMFRNKGGGYYVNRQQTLGRGYGFDKILDDISLRGNWNDIVVHVRWTFQDTGIFHVWVNGKKAYDYSGPTMGQNTKVYFKFGIYRAFISRYKERYSASGLPVQVIYFDEVRRGRTRAEVTKYLK